MKTFTTSHGQNKDSYIIKLNNGELRQFKKKRLYQNCLAFLVKDGFKPCY